ncbi:MAG: DUF3276 family protein [Bacteroidia bacterium]|nr:DUF3276 family protein [Bacteroidia bacterium]
MEENEFKGRNEVFSKSVRAGKKRTYFFDVKETRSNDFYLVITESKKKFDDNGGPPMYEKHKIFLYREDFDKFLEAFNETTEHITSIAPPLQPREPYSPPAESETTSQPPPPENKSEFTDLNFEDLGGEEPKE